MGFYPKKKPKFLFEALKSSWNFCFYKFMKKLIALMKQKMKKENAQHKQMKILRETNFGIKLKFFPKRLSQYHFVKNLIPKRN